MRVAKRFPAKKTSSCIWNRGNWVEGNRGIEQYRNEETREQGNGEQGNNGTRERGNRGTRGQRNRGAREEGMPIVWTKGHVTTSHYQNFSYVMITKFSYSWCSAARESSSFNTQWLKHDFFGRYSGTSEKVFLFSRTQYSKRKFVQFHLYKAISFIPSRSFFR